MLEVATTVAPAVGPLRRLFGGPPNGDAAAPTDGEGARARWSIEDLRDDLRDLFDHDPGARIVVLLDDLDRCQPQVALDVLETIKIFLFESAGTPENATGRQGAQCLFLVAADERLVAQGLRARFGSDVPDDEARAYLEKIVQLGVDLPAVEPAGAYALVAEWAPEWAAAADLIVAGLAGNPRRMKQQSTLLSYRFWALEQDATPDEETREHRLRRVLHKLARLRAVCPEAIEHLLDPAVDLQAHEAIGPEPAESDPEGPLAELLRSQPRARVLFTAAPSVAGIPRATLKVFAAAPDIRPGPDGAPVSDDRVFMYIARAVTEQYGNMSIERLNNDYLQAVLRLCGAIPEIVPILRSVARHHDRYMEAVAQFDDWLDGDPAGDEEVELASTGAQRLVDLCRPRLADERRAGEGEPLRTALMQSPRLSEIPVEHVRTVQAKHIDETRDDQKTDRTSSWLFALLTTATKMLRSATRRRVLEASIEARLVVAKDIVERRKFVKLQLLRSRWPEFADLGASQRASRRCQDIEKVVLRNDPDVQLSDADRTLAGDETLRALLGIRPFFDQMFLGDVATLTATPEQRPTVPAEGTVASAAPPRPLERYASLELELALSPSDANTATVSLVHGTDRHSGSISPPVRRHPGPARARCGALPRGRRRAADAGRARADRVRRRCPQRPGLGPLEHDDRRAARRAGAIRGRARAGDASAARRKDDGAAPHGDSLGMSLLAGRAGLRRPGAQAVRRAQRNGRRTARARSLSPAAAGARGALEPVRGSAPGRRAGGRDPAPGPRADRQLDRPARGRLVENATYEEVQRSLRTSPHTCSTSWAMASSVTATATSR